MNIEKLINSRIEAIEEEIKFAIQILVNIYAEERFWHTCSLLKRILKQKIEQQSFKNSYKLYATKNFGKGKIIKAFYKNNCNRNIE